MSDYFTTVRHARSAEWHALVEAANDWQQAYDLLLHYEATSYSQQDELRTQRAAQDEQRTYDAWTHALVAFERAENTRRLFA